MVYRLLNPFDITHFTKQFSALKEEKEGRGANPPVYGINRSIAEKEPRDKVEHVRL